MSVTSLHEMNPRKGVQKFVLSREFLEKVQGITVNPRKRVGGVYCQKCCNARNRLICFLSLVQQRIDPKMGCRVCNVVNVTMRGLKLRNGVDGCAVVNVNMHRMKFQKGGGGCADASVTTYGMDLWVNARKRPCVVPVTASDGCNCNVMARTKVQNLSMVVCEGLLPVVVASRASRESCGDVVLLHDY